MSNNSAITLKCEELVAAIIRRALPGVADLIVEGSDQTCDLPHPVYISVMQPEGEDAEPQLPSGPIYNVPIDVIRMAHYAHSTHAERKEAVGKLQGIFKGNLPLWAHGRIVPGVFLKGWFIESIGGGDSGDYVGDGMRLVLAVLEA